jgi:hypothetical protein|tara:strand:+ start:229 stop:426 length:198 start_codon:yes stop_codon:yes gene_type:complete
MTDKEELRQKLRDKITAGQLQRSSKQKKEYVVEKSLKKMGIDKEKLEKDMQAVKNQGGLSVNLNK